LNVGVEFQSDDSDFNVSGVQCSSSLAHLRYYSLPISASSSIENDNSRIYFNEFASVSLGALATVLSYSYEAAGLFSACLEQINNLSDDSLARYLLLCSSKLSIFPSSLWPLNTAIRLSNATIHSCSAPHHPPPFPTRSSATTILTTFPPWLAASFIVFLIAVPTVITSSMTRTFFLSNEAPTIPPGL